MKFITDGMLGKLTRWLRLAGKDVVCINDYSVSPKEEDKTLIHLAKKDSRILITRDTDLHKRALKNKIESILIEETEDIAKQLAEVSKSIEEPIEVSIENSRCSVCNGELKRVEKNSFSEEVPESVLENKDKFWKCNNCGKVYWAGSHWQKIAETVERYKDLRG